MPNYRQKNKNRRNNNKNNNKNQNKNQNQKNQNQAQNKQQQQQQQQQDTKNDNELPQTSAETINAHDVAPTCSTDANAAAVAAQVKAECVEKTCDFKDLKEDPCKSAQVAEAKAEEEEESSSEVFKEGVQPREEELGEAQIALETGEAEATTPEGSIKELKDSREDSDTIQDPQIASADAAMGTKHSKQRQIGDQPDSESSQREQAAGSSDRTQIGKVVVHRIIRDSGGDGDDGETKHFQEPGEVTDEVITPQIELTSPKVIVHPVRVEPAATAEEPAKKQVKVIIHKVILEEETATEEAKADPETEDSEGKPELSHYQVQSPVTVKTICKLPTTPGDLLIQEVSDGGSLSDTNDNPPVVSEAESEPETTMSPTREIATLKEDHGEVDEEDEASYSLVGGDELKASSKQRRAQKRVALEAHFLPQLLAPRYLDSISEENSDMSDARSDCSDRPVHPSTSAQAHEAAKKANVHYPRSHLDFSRKHKHAGVIREEPQAMRVETKIIESPLEEASESCLTLASVQEPESEAAELVYINSASSSASDLLDLDLERSVGSEAAPDRAAGINLDTDVSELITQPQPQRRASAESATTTTTSGTATDEYSATDSTVDYSSASASRESTPVNHANDGMENGERQGAAGGEEQSPKFYSTFPTLSEEARQSLESIVHDLKSFSAGSSSHHAMDHLAGEAPATAVRPASSNSETERPTSSSSSVSSVSKVSSESVQMNNVREIVQSYGGGGGASEKASRAAADALGKERLCEEFLRSLDGAEQFARDSPPPIPPPPAADQLHSPPMTASPTPTPPPPPQKHQPLLQQQLQQLHEVIEANRTYGRQESADSTSTTHSQCTAINVGPLSTRPLNPNNNNTTTTTTNNTNNTPDLPTCPQLHPNENGADVIPSLSASTAPTTATGTTTATTEADEASIKKLRQLCAETLASMPYGTDVLEELATVAQNIGEVQAVQRASAHKMPYPLPQLPHIDDLQLSVSGEAAPSSATRAPPKPGAPDSWLGIPSEQNPRLLVCLSPYQQQSLRNEKEPQRPDDLLDAHRRFVERRGYHEYTAEQVREMNGQQAAALGRGDQQQAAEESVLKTAMIMKQLRKSLTPSPSPPPIPPPPVPHKSSETAAKAQSFGTNTNNNSSNNNVSVRNNDNSKNAMTTEARTTLLTTTTTNRTQYSNGKASDGEEQQNANRLLAIIHDHEPAAASSSPAPPVDQSSRQAQDKTSSVQNSSRQAVSNSTSTTTTTNSATDQSAQNSHQQSFATASKMQQDTSSSFPCNNNNIFDEERRRFSNIETASPGFASAFAAQPKRFSNIETHSYESRKRIENGQVVYDVTNSSHEKQHGGGGDEVDRGIDNGKFPLSEIGATSAFAQPNAMKIAAEFPSLFDNYAKSNGFTKAEAATPSMPPPPPPPAPRAATSAAAAAAPPSAEEIMSALKLNTNIESTTSTTTSSSTENSHPQQQQPSAESRNVYINRPHGEYTTASEQKSSSMTTSTTASSAVNSSYDEFRQRAKAAAEQTTPITAPAPSTFNGSGAGDQRPSVSSASGRFDHENLFKDFDDLSKQLHMELEAGRERQRLYDRSTSMFDLGSGGMPHVAPSSSSKFRQQFEELKKKRHEHMKELEQEIERSMKSRQLRQQTPTAPQRVVQIPVQREQQYDQQQQQYQQQQQQHYQQQQQQQHYEQQQHGSYDIPIQIESSAPPTPIDHSEESRFRRAESMFNLQTDAYGRAPRQRSNSFNDNGSGAENGNYDDWARYAADLGSSQNITRPFAREVEICYNRLRPNAIRAPRLTASTNDLSTSQQHSYCDNFYNTYSTGRRLHAPMIPEQAVPTMHKGRPQYMSCHSMIERNPNPTYISTTTRRGVSPAPATMSMAAREQQRPQYERRASLPREIHEQQLKYITSKEEELRTEFERLQNERQRLMDEMIRTQADESAMQAVAPPPPMRPKRDSYRGAPKLPTLSEDEVFRQQMAEEWMSKIAEREQRRLQKVIKISKLNEQQLAAGNRPEPHEHIIPVTHQHSASGKPDLSSEFLNRVHERRTKLSMPADSDWESGAESQPNRAKAESDVDEQSPLKVIDGKTQATVVSELPKHLREFAKFSTHHKDDDPESNTSREVHHEEEHRREADPNSNSVCSASKKSSIVKTIKIARDPSNANQLYSSVFKPTEALQGERPANSDTEFESTENTANTTTVETTSSEYGRASETTRASAPPTPLTPPPTPTPSAFDWTQHHHPIRSKLPMSFGEMFAASPFRHQIQEEFDSYWRAFDHAPEFFAKH